MLNISNKNPIEKSILNKVNARKVIPTFLSSMDFTFCIIKELATKKPKRKPWMAINK
jgi:hypothetical protein